MIDGKPLGKPAAIYVRLSQDRPGEVSTAVQEAQARALCEQRGWEVGEVYVDAGLSGFKDVHRPAFERLLTNVERGLVGAAVVFKVDRVARSVRQFVRFTGIIAEHGAVLASVHDPVDTSTPVGRAVLGVLAVFAELESEQTSLRLRSANQHRAELGQRHAGGMRPFGYEADRLTISPGEAELLHEAARRFLDGDSLRSIADDWNARGVRTSADGPWTGRGISCCLRSPRLGGWREHNGVLYKAAWEPVFAEDLHVELQNALADSRGRAARRTEARHLLAGLVFCGLCGGPMQAKGRQMRYSCRRDPGRRGCGRVSIVSEETEELVTSLATEVASSSDLLAAGADQDVEDLRRLTEQAMADDQAALEELSRDYYVSRTLTREELLASRPALTERIEEGRSTLRRLVGTQVASGWPTTVEGLRERLAQVDDLATRRKLLQTLILRVEIAPVVKGANRFDPNRVTVVWRV